MVGFTPEEVFELCTLRDLYEELLPRRQREVMHLKLDEDLSLAEIAERLGISRQACEDALKRCQRALWGYEERLGLKKRRDREVRDLREIMLLMESMNHQNWEKHKAEILLRLKCFLAGGDQEDGV